MKKFSFDLKLIIQVMSVKALGTALKLTFEGKNQLIYLETWFFMFVVATCVITQMNYLNKVSNDLAYLFMKINLCPKSYDIKWTTKLYML